ncbi:hypothetical protein HKX48_002591 [Thoreauomyces humboldtii]|nr:hypothetical protein HKX48_002591 [Thoreauomyces humboldtii]
MMRRMSSFGGAPIFIPPPPLKIGAEAGPDEHVPAASNLRWFVLALTCLLLFGNYYAYDNPAALNKPLQEYLGHEYDTWQYELNLLYSVYSFPNMFLPFIGGQLVDRLDVKKVLVVFSIIVCAGQTLFAVGVSTKNFPVMLIGRVFFGIGGESIGVVQASVTTAWFRGKELGFALGLNLCIARFGSVVNANLSPRIEKIWGSSGAVWVGSLTCYASLCCSIALVTLMAHHSPGETRSPTKRSSQSEEEAPLLDGLGESSSSLSDPLLEKGLGEMSSSPVSSEFDEQVSWRDSIREIAMFPWAFWLVCLICVLLYGTVVPFNNIASDFLMSKWYPGDTQTAGTVMSIPDTMSAILVPICGVLVDRYGGRASLLLLCALVIAAVHTCLGLTMINPVYPLILLGLSYSMYGVAIWPSVACIIQHREDAIHEQNPDSPPPKLLGTAYGLSTSCLNTALTIMPLVSAQIRVWGGSFVPVELFFVALALGGAGASTVLWIVDGYNGSILQRAEMDDGEESTDDDDEDEDYIRYNTAETEPLLAAAGRINKPTSTAIGGGFDEKPPLHRRAPPSEKYANQPFKPGKAFGIKVKTRGRLDDFLVQSPTSETGPSGGSGSGH